MRNLSQERVEVIIEFKEQFEDSTNTDLLPAGFFKKGTLSATLPTSHFPQVAVYYRIYDGADSDGADNYRQGTRLYSWVDRGTILCEHNALGCYPH